MTSHEQHNQHTNVPKPDDLPYDPQRQIKEDEEKMVKDAVRGVFIVMIIIGSLGVGAFFALYAEDSYRAGHPPEILNKATWGKSPDHMFTNPVLFVDGDKGDYPEFEPLDNELNGYIAEAKKKGTVESVSVYFRDLNSGHWTGVNEDGEYMQTDDLQKIMLVLAYDKNAGHDPAVMSQELYYQNDFHSVQDLIGDMFRYPDDMAEKVLASFHPEYAAGAYADFHLKYAAPAMTPVMQGAKISARQYAAIFHNLYDGTYLSSDLSEKDLRLFALTNWNKGIVAGMRSGIATDPEAGHPGDDAAEDATSTTVVAHTFGEYDAISASGAVTSRELHDCGIVYFPLKPYILCVMTRSGGASNATGTAPEDFPALGGVISTISRLTYNYVDGR